MPYEEIFVQIGTATGLGLLVGLQRQRVDSPMAGVRTFPLITLFGTLSALLSREFGGWAIAGAFIALAAITVIGNVIVMKRGASDPGLTTEFAMLVMFSVGAFLVIGPAPVAVVIGGGVAVLLQFKARLHTLVQHFGDEDLTAIMRFALIALVILPLLPNQTFGPWGVLNPFEIWLMVVLIVGISLGAYIVYKFFGTRAGTLAGGILGGLISSTATTVSYSRRTRNVPNSSGIAAVVIMIASTILLLRVLIEIWIVAPAMLETAASPILTLFGVFVILSGAAWARSRRQNVPMPSQKSPSELRPALIFGALYAIVIIAVAAVKEHFGEGALYAVAAVSGLTDVDAMTLSSAQLVDSGRLGMATGWRLILTATLSNLLFKAGIVAVLGRRRLLGIIALLYGIGMLAGLAILFLWP